MTSSEGSWAAILQQCGGARHLDRERGLRSLSQQLPGALEAGNAGATEAASCVYGGVLSMMKAGTWEQRLGGLTAAKVLCQAFSTSQPPPVAASADNQSPTNGSTVDQAPPAALGSKSGGVTLPQGWQSHLQSHALSLLEDPEPRVRTAVGELLGMLASMQGTHVFMQVEQPLLASILRNYDRDGQGPDGHDDGAQQQNPSTQQQDQQQLQQASKLPPRPCDPSGGAASSSSTPAPAGTAAGASQEQTDAQGVGDHVKSPSGSKSEGSSSPPGQGGGGLLSELLQESYKLRVPGVAEMRHGTEGWQALETSMRALAAVMEGALTCTAAIDQQYSACTSDASKQYSAPLPDQQGGRPQAIPLAHALSQSLLDLVARSMHHPNRFVREASHATASAMFRALAAVAGDSPDSGSREDDASSHEPLEGRGQLSLHQVAVRLAPLLADGLTDNWSQVRYTACVATRTLLKCLAAHPSTRAAVLPHLLPPMCLNRYYVADGVRRYSQETWVQVMGDQGRASVAAHINQVVSYYVAQSKSSNHAVREAACACTAELAEKVHRAAVEPHIPQLLRALLTCFKDFAWPVRDAAAVACGRVLLAYPDVCAPFLPELLELWVAHLWDNVQSVRENSARALGDALRAVPGSGPGNPLDVVTTAIREQLPLASSQPHDPPRGRSPSRHRSRSPQPDHAATLGVDTQQQGEQQERPAAAEAAQGLSSGSAAPGTQLLVSSQQGPGNDGPGSTSISNGSRDGSSGNNGLNSQHLAARLPSSQRSGQSPVRRPPLLGRPRSPSPIRRMSLGGSPRGGTSRALSPGAGGRAARVLSPSRAREQELKALLAEDPGLFGDGEDLALFGDRGSAAARFNTSYYVKGDGCMDFGFAREQEPWEGCDGAVFMVRELAQVSPEAALPFLGPLADHAAGADGFEAAPKLRETVWRCLPAIGRAIGKQALKHHLEPFLGPLFADLSCGTPLTETAAGKAVGWLRDTLGPNILAARLTEAQAAALRSSPHVPPPQLPARPGGSMMPSTGPGVPSRAGVPGFGLGGGLRS